MSDQIKYNLNESDLPRFWYNIAADSPVPPTPVFNPITREPITPDFLAAIFPMGLILQEISSERYIEIPEEVREIYKLWRPTPLTRARRLEKVLGTPAHIYYKYEGVSPSGSHKSNTAVAQAFYNKIEGTKTMTTETGAGQWGTAMSMATRFFGMGLEVYMVKVSYGQKPYRRFLMETYGAEVFASPSNLTHCGRAILEKDPNNPGSLGIAISEAVEAAVVSGGVKKYGLGSQPCSAAPNCDRRGSPQANGNGRRISRCGHRLCWRRLQFLRDRLPLPAREPEGRPAHPFISGRTHGHSLAHPGNLHL
jgi:tryptophan synthase beta chain